MEVIGFANKYYTLWNISTRVVKEDGNKRYTSTSYHFIKNISIDKDKAFAKYPNAEFNENLRGIHHSFETKPKVEWLTIDEFRFGKYCHQKIQDSKDSEYIRWYFSSPYLSVDHAEFVKNELIRRGYHIDSNNLVYSPEEYENFLKQQKIFENIHKQRTNKEPIQLEIKYNFSEDGIYYDKDTYTQYLFDGKMQKYYYNGVEYYLPTINGVGKRVKNKTILIDDYDVTEYDNGTYDVEFNDFKILKTKK